MSKTTTMPNIRKMFVPDEGYTIFDVDLAGADAQVVAYEAEDEDLIKAFKEGLDVHDKNARELFGGSYTALTGPARAKRRKESKQAVHATNYGGSPRTLAKVLGWTVREAESFQRRWFGLHPGIKANFHGRIESSLQQSRMVTNRFGYRRVYFDRIDSVFTEALAWVPQSTVAETSFRGALALEGACPWVEMLLQVHDSLVFQVPHDYEDHITELRAALTVPIPYPDPLIIQWGIARSRVSWGDCEPIDGGKL
jgi:DNA polymerase-1